MSLEELKADFAANSDAVKALDPALTTNSELVNLLKFTVWPFLENVVTELGEIDEAVQDMVDGVEDLLHEETAGVIAAPIIAARVIIAKYKATLPASAKEELVAIKAWEKMAKEAEETISEIVVHDPTEDEPDGDDEDDEDDDADEDDDKENG